MAVTSAERKALSKLPSALSRWEVGIIAMPVPIEGVDAEGILVVVEQGTGLARAGAPLVRGDPLWPVVRDACLSAGSGGHPSSPRALCTTRDLAPRLRRDVEGSGIQDEPWRTLPDRVTFRFDTSDPDLAAAVAVVLGKAGEQEGVALYRSVEGYERFLEAAIARDPDLPVADALCLYIDPLADLSDSEVREIRSLELVLPGGRAPRLIAIRDGLPRAPDSQEQRTLLAATEAIARLSLTHLARLDSEPHEAALSTCLGPMTVRSHPGATKRRPEPAPPGTLVSDIEHAVILSKVQIPHEDRPHEEAARGGPPAGEARQAGSWSPHRGHDRSQARTFPWRSAFDRGGRGRLAKRAALDHREGDPAGELHARKGPRSWFRPTQEVRFWRGKGTHAMSEFGFAKRCGEGRVRAGVAAKERWERAGVSLRGE